MRIQTRNFVARKCLPDNIQYLLYTRDLMSTACCFPPLLKLNREKESASSNREKMKFKWHRTMSYGPNGMPTLQLFTS